MAASPQFDCMDGGDRAANNTGYYGQCGVSNLASITAYNAKNYLYGNQGSPAVWTPSNGFSAAAAYFGVLFVDNNSVLTTGAVLHIQSSAGNDQVTVQQNANGSLSVYCGSTVLWTSGANVVHPNVPYYLEGYVSLSATTGAVSLWINDNPSAICALTNVNTLGDTANDNICKIAWGAASSNGGARDFYIHDGTGAAPFNGKLGQGSALWLPVSVVKTNNGWAPNGASSLDLAAATTPPNASTIYDSASVTASAMVLGLTALPSNVISVLAVRAIDYAAKSDSGSRALQKTLTFGAHASVGTENYLALAPVVYQDAWVLTDPTTSALFANEGSTGIAAVNNAQLTETVAV